MTRRGSSPVFVGRRAELDQLEAAFGRAALGQPSLVLVGGEAGVGKSRLIAEFSARAEATGATIIAGGCLDLGEGGVPYAPFAEAFRALARRLDSSARDALFEPSADALSALLPELRSRLIAADPAAPEPTGRLARLFDAVLDVLGRLAEQRPLAVVIEDIHWADGSTRDLIRFLIRNLRDERLLVLATYRTDDLHRRHPLMPLLGELQRADRVERVELRPFDREELSEQVTGITGVPPSPELLEALIQRSDGLPFYVEELIAGAGADASRLPETLRDIVASRLAVLSPASRALVQAAAVIGGRFTHERLAAVASQPEAALLNELYEAVDARILVSSDDADVPGYAFRHALLREAAYDELLPAERVSLHARLADHLDASVRSMPRPDASILGDVALHAYQAHDLPRALQGSVRALRAFIEAVAFREALGHAERALELWPRVVDPSDCAGIDHAELLALAGRMAAAANRPELAMTLSSQALAELEQRDDREGQARLLVDLQWYAWESRDFDVSVSAAERAYELSAPSEPSWLKAQATMILGSQRWWQGRLQESVRLLEEAMRLTEALDDRAGWAQAADMLVHTYTELGQGVRAASLLDRSSESDLDGGWPLERISSQADRSIAALMCGRFSEAERVATVGLALAERYGWDARFGPYFRSCIVDALFEMGRYDETDSVARPVLSSAGPLHARQWMATSMARVAVAQGRIDEGHRLLDRAPKSQTLNEETFTTAAVVDLARAEGRFPEVVRAVDAIAEGIADREAVSPAWGLLGAGIGACADGVTHARRRRRPADGAALAGHAERWLATLTALAVRHRDEGGAGPFFEAILATAEGEIGRVRKSSEPEAWAVASERWASLSQPQQTAYARFRLAEAILQAGGDRMAAEAALRDSHAIASAIGAAPLRSAAEELASSARLRLGTGDAIQGDAGESAAVLTSREREVLRLVAEGHTNREIGDRLFISEKTASVHVSNAMAKLGALSRYEAAASAQRLGHLR